MSTLEVIKLVVTSGELGLLALVLFGLFRLAVTLGPPLLTAVAANTTRLATLEAKIDGLERAVSETRSRASEASEDVAEIRGALSTGQHAAITVERPPLPSAPDRRRP